MRLFLAINFSDEVKKKIDEQLKWIKSEYPQCSWINPNKYHLTLFFYGSIDNPEKIIKRLSNLLYDQEKFYLYPMAISLLMKNRILIYLNFLRQKKLERLAKKILVAFSMGNKHKNNFKVFFPHLSLAHYRIPSKQQYLLLKKKLKTVDMKFEYLVSKITLFESISKKEGVVYKKIKEFPLINKTIPK